MRCILAGVNIVAEPFRLPWGCLYTVKAVRCNPSGLPSLLHFFITEKKVLLYQQNHLLK